MIKEERFHASQRYERRLILIENMRKGKPGAGLTPSPAINKECKMKRKFHKNDEWCPECGHLLPKKTWNCQFCGWSLNDLQMYDSEIDYWDDYSTMNNIPGIDSDIDIDRLINNS